MTPISLYIHIPFCASRCGYCNFYSTTQVGLMDSYTAALCHAIATAPLDNREAVTLYLGGGTPSLMGLRLLDILAAVRATIPLAANAEVTLEANPDAVSGELLQQLRRGGFNRISFGLQSDSDDSLRLLGRRHTVDGGRQAVKLARQAGFDNISVDVMLATPGQDVGGAARLCSSAVSLGVEHVSAYLLKVEEGTPFGAAGIAARCPDDDLSADIYLAACDTLASAGYRHYEVSNFARVGYESRHNSVYWQLGDYLGIGPSAYSLVGGRRFHFPPDLEGFVASANPWDSLVQDETGGDATEYLLLSLRLADGCSLVTLREQYGVDTSRLPMRLQPLAADGLASLDGEVIRLTDRGMLLSNSVINYLLDGIC